MNKNYQIKLLRRGKRKEFNKYFSILVNITKHFYFIESCEKSSCTTTDYIDNNNNNNNINGSLYVCRMIFYLSQLNPQ